MKLARETSPVGEVIEPPLRASPLEGDRIQPVKADKPPSAGERVFPPSLRTPTAAGERVGHGVTGTRVWALSWLAPVTLLILWELLARAGVIQTIVLPAPSTVLVTARNLLESGELQHNLLASLRRAMTGFVAGASLGLILGALVGSSRVADALIDRTVQIVRAVPFLAIVPLVIVWFGVGETSKVFLIALGSLFPMYLNTSLGFRQVDPKLLEMGRVMGLSRTGLVFSAILPGAVPSILNGMRLALTTSWLALVVAESIGASAGIGFLATNAREFLQTDVMVLVIVLYALIGIASDLLARLLERRLLAWHPNYAKTRA